MSQHAPGEWRGLILQAKKIASEFGVNEKTLWRATEFAEAVEKALK